MISMYFPPPKGWDDFQDLICELAKSEFKKETVLSYGRLGQKQHGIDVFAESFSNEKYGIQCKETKGIINKSLIITEANEAMSFKPDLTVFRISTTMRTDKKLQDDLKDINVSKAYPFHIQISFWDDIIRDINKSFSIINSFYKIYQSQFSIEEKQFHLEAIKSAFDRPAFKDNYLQERNYEHFEEAIVSIKRLLRTGYLYDRDNNLISNIVPADRIGDKSYQKLILQLEKEVEKLYNKIMADKIRFENNPKLREELAGTYNDSRRKIIEFLNKKIIGKMISEIVVNY